MEISRELVQRVAGDIGVSTDDLMKFAALGEERDFEKGDYLFHEGAPRQWFGIVLQGRIELQRGLSGRHVNIAVLTDGAVIGESLFIDDLDHSVSGQAKEATRVWTIGRARIEACARRSRTFSTAWWREPPAASGSASGKRPGS